MDLLDRLLRHDAWTTRQLLIICRDLSDDRLDREFDLAHRSVRATLAHIVRNVEAWSDLMAGREIREGGGNSVDDLIERLDRAAADLAGIARSVAERAGWDEGWLDPLENPPVERTFGGTIAHVVTHSMHHRAQVIHLLKRLGVENVPEGDVLGWENRASAE